MRVTLLFGTVAILMIVPSQAQNTTHAKLEGIEAECARNIAAATWEVLSDQSWTQLSRLLSLGGAAEMTAAIGGAIRAELRECFVAVYRRGVEDGKRIRSQQ